MSEEAPEEPLGQAVARPAHSRWWPFHDWKEARARFKDLLVVFFGVYAAFLLNRFETDRRDTIRRRQLFEALEHEVDGTVKSMKDELAEAQVGIGEFDRRLTAGEMPPLGISYTSSAYNASDDATLLQAGGLELLDVETLDQMREVNQLQRSVVEKLRNNYQLELALLGNHENADFYDPTTHQLRRQYAWYPVTLHRLLASAQELLAAEEKFLALIRSRQQDRPR